MNVNAINKTPRGKRSIIEAEELRKKARLETVQILKVQPELRQVEGNYETLQQNTVEEQMQHEPVSVQCQEEQRMRPDTLNKVNSTHEVCDELMEYGARLADTLSRLRAGRLVLDERCQSSSQVRELSDHAESSRSHFADLGGEDLVGDSHSSSSQRKVELLIDHQKQLVELFTVVKKQSATESNELSSQLASALARGGELAAANNELTRILEVFKRDIEKRDHMNQTMHTQLDHMIEEYNKLTMKAGVVLAREEKENTSHEKINELISIIKTKDQRLNSQSRTITQLMTQVKQLEIKIHKNKTNTEAERDTVMEREKKMTITIEQLNMTIKSKDEKLSKQMIVIRNIKNEKKRLQEKILDLEKLRDNIQKEQTKPISWPSTSTAARLQPEPNDNAVMLTSSQFAQLATSRNSPAAQRAHESSNAIYDKFSDSSTECPNLETHVPQTDHGSKLKNEERKFFRSVRPTDKPSKIIARYDNDRFM